MKWPPFLCSVLTAFFLMTAASVGSETKEPKVTVELLAEREALVPGRSVALAIPFKLESKWHLYWQNPGEGGMEPIFKWNLPAGYQVGPMRFPSPSKRHVDAEADLHTFILEGDPVILTQLSVPTSAKPGEKATIGLEIEYLVCQEICVRGQRSLTIDLPVAADDAHARSVHADVFKSAMLALPAPADQPKYLDAIQALAGVDKVRPGVPFEVKVTLKIKSGHHINSQTPLSPSLIPTDLFPARTESLTIGRPRFPPGHIEEPSPPEGLSPAQRLTIAPEKVSVYRDKVVVTVPVEVNESLRGETIRIGGVVKYQACSDVTRTCFPPTSAEWGLTLPVAAAQNGAEVVRNPGTVPPEPRGTANAGGSSTSRPAGDTGERKESAALSASSDGTSTGTTGVGLLSRIDLYLASFGTLGRLLVAFLGGLLMNLMPCVLPVISIKILSFVQQAKESRLRVLTLGLAFAGGIQVSFVVFGLLILGLLRSLGLELQWGGLFQSPVILISFAAIVTALALSLFGVFTLSPPQFVLEVGGRVQQEGHVSAFAMGLLATVLGTACTAPFVSGAVAWAVSQPSAVGMLIFIVLGFGMALPYAVLAAKPAWLKFVPRPGPWMETFEHIMGFVLLGTVAWLLYPLVRQIGGEGLLWTIVFLLFVAAATWCYGRVSFGAGTARQVVCYGGTVLLIVGGWWLCFRYQTRISDLVARQRALAKGIVVGDPVDWKDTGEIPWIPYARQRTLDLVNAGKTVFIDYTADWCASCKYNEKVVINTPQVRDLMRRLGVVPVRADYTLEDPEIKADLERFKRAGVPMYVIFPAHRPGEPILLSEILTQAAVIDGLKRAGPSTEAPLSMAATGRP